MKMTRSCKSQIILTNHMARPLIGITVPTK